MYRGHLSPRRALVLAEHLPEGGPYWAHVAENSPHDPTTVDETKVSSWRGWTYDRFLLAAIVDALAGANWQRGGGGRRPDPVRRPQLRTPTGRDRMRARAAAHRRRGGGNG